jgi:two-component system phosphate regulon sensor histidine kinase PhoR
MNLALRILSVSLPFFVLLPLGAGLWFGKEPSPETFKQFFYAYLAAQSVSIYFAVRATRDIVRPVRSLLARLRRFPDIDSRAETPSDLPEIAQLVNRTDEFMNRLRAQVLDLEGEKALLGSLLNGLREGVVCLGEDGTIVFTNENVDRDLMERLPAGKPYFKTIRNADLLEYMRGKLSGKQGHNGRIEFSGHGKSFIVTFNEVVFTASSRLLLFLIHDNTQEYNTRRLREDFLQNASHELKTPITSIRGYTETIAYRAQDPQQVKFLGAILRNVERMERLIEDMLTVSKIESGNYPFQPQNIDLDSYIENLSALVTGFLAPRRQTIDFQIQNTRAMNADPILLEHLVLNLIDNASRYSPDEGRIVVRFGCEDGKQFIEVQDQGPGIREDMKEKIFERFFRADENRSRAEGGSGLGLSIVRHIARIHQGQVSVENSPAGGAVFRFAFPPAPQGKQI